MPEFIDYTVEDHVGVITLNRPETMNALNRQMYAELEQAFRDAHRDPDVRCVVLTGNGRAFCSGDDVRQIMLGEQRDETVARLRDAKPKPTPAATAVLDCDKPVICAVNGAAVGWGMDLALFADIRIASESAKFGELFIKRGLVADLGGLWRLPRVVGPSKAAELLFTGDIIPAQEAERIGLVSRVVPPAELMPAAMEMARKIAQNPPIALRYMKEGLRRSVHGTMAEMGEYVGNSLAYLFTTEDHKEGALSFVERREPVFKGR
ncbi:MAG: enoyl-CoA hydratase/isomerase family protein [Dehalococcoidia bacterium]|jgi:enoyl-CoA hydratase/carnithine racemase|uniref:enoyl-CoA hydratase/isomerase family protein n=1 Tax=Candidatus Amarobacter glycogenicus TaxID=3140699 RepID=UPI001D682491|nr:enoyl-CoA hydratase/isomerase family protein [Dehalococcoidia bacterium]MBK7725856.1 enoyl-CoA hydratase/isomerase family protein [Dehalococcoidia bacterium]MBK8558411.1 enoyl-CoA hydratase/isomerase family protein [Dehalococcoidia bacterium]MBK9343974.1 enoyl-CoA hydratase/isomerase family protein [Dehalococcoidia bacterium]MBK9547370.1 enoyl-CoA hydratase/isomerase family protein [Dehalococcoidia bacterium]